jgi:hypothetical protein
MPNWVMNELICTFPNNEQFESFKNKINLEGLFNSFISMPEILDGTQSPNINPEKIIADFNKEGNTATTLQEVVDSGHHWFSGMAKQAIKNQEAFKATGYYDWFSWSVNKWGVKWDASNPTAKFDLLEITLCFDTAWDCPEQFVRTLSTLYPEVNFVMITGSIENDNHYEFAINNGEYEEICCYGTFKEAVEDGKWGGMSEWEILFEESEEVTQA